MRRCAAAAATDRSRSNRSREPSPRVAADVKQTGRSRGTAAARGSARRSSAWRTMRAGTRSHLFTTRTTARPGLVGVAGDVRVLRGHALRTRRGRARATWQRSRLLQRHHHRQLLERLGSPSPCAGCPRCRSGRRDARANVERRVDRVARGARARRGRAPARCPSIALTSDDLPTLGRPMTATRVPCRAACSAAGARARDRAPLSSSSATPRPCSAETGSTGAKPRR